MPIALEEGKVPFVDEETEAQIIEINLLQLLGIQRQTGKEPGIGTKAMRVRGRWRPHPALCHLSTL